VGVASQYAGVVGKTANCQSLVSLTLAKGEVPVPIVLRLFLPDTWIKDPERLQHAGVPEAFWTDAPSRRSRWRSSSVCCKQG
jgi:SRSO17 transposase